MAYKRKRRYSRRRKTYTRKRFRRYTRSSRRSLRRRNNVSHFKRTAGFVAVSTTAGASEYLSAGTFSLNNLPAITDFTTLYDVFRLNCVVLKYTPDYRLTTTTTGTASASLPQIVPEIHWAIDTDDNTVPASISDIAQRRTYHHRPFNSPVTIKVFPKVSTIVYRTATTFAYASPKGKTWIDVASIDTPHYGLKWGINNIQTGSNQTVSFKIWATYYFSCKDYR